MKIFEPLGYGMQGGTRPSVMLTGVVYGQPGTVTGYPIHRAGAGPIATVSLLADDGEIVDHVRVPADVVDAVRVTDLTRSSDWLVWRIADRNHAGMGGHALAELARRERSDRQRWNASVTAGVQGGAR